MVFFISYNTLHPTGNLGIDYYTDGKNLAYNGNENAIFRG